MIRQRYCPSHTDSCNGNKEAARQYPASPSISTGRGITLEQVRVIDKSRLDGFIIRLDEEKLYEVDYALAVSVGLENALAVC